LKRTAVRCTTISKGSSMSTSTQQALPTGTFADDGVHSTAGFAVKYMGVTTFRGRFEDVTARLTVDEHRAGVLEGSVDVDSIRVKDENLAGHLRAPDFFDAANHPNVTFRSTAIRFEGDELVVDGDLTIKGTTRSVAGRGALTGPLEDAFGNTKVGITLSAVLDRTEFGLNWNAPLPKGGWALANDVTLTVELSLGQQG